MEVSHAERVVFPEIGRTKGDVVAYYEALAARILPHVEGRPLSMKRYPKGIAAPGFFQKNVPPHYPASIERFAVPRSPEATKRYPPKRAAASPKRASGGASARKKTAAAVETPPAEETLYPVLRRADDLPYLANQGAIELHVGLGRVPDLHHPDRIVVDLDPPANALALVRRAAHVAREALATLGLATVPVATGSKGYHLVAPIAPALSSEELALTLHKLATLLAAGHPDELTVVFRVANRGPRVFVDWLRNNPNATVIVPYAVRARARATVAVPLAWSEVDRVAPDAFSIDDARKLLDRDDPLVTLARTPADPRPFAHAVERAFDAAGLTLESFDRFRS